MKKQGLGHIKGESVHDVPKKDYGLDQKDNGSMDYMRVQDKFCAEDAHKVKRGEYRYNRYE